MELFKHHLSHSSTSTLEAMQERESTVFHPLSMCHRLFGFILRVARSLKYMTLAHSMPSHGSTAAPDIGCAANGLGPVNGESALPRDKDSSLGREQATPQKSRTSSSCLSPARGKDPLELSLVQDIGVFDGISLSLVQDKANSSKFEGKGSNEGLGKGGPKWSAEEKGKKKKEEEMETENSRPSTEWEEEWRLAAGSKPRSPLSFAYNINEKSDAFIRTRKAAMRETL